MTSSSGIVCPMNGPQTDFFSLPHKYRSMVCGYGTGKTWAGCIGFLHHFINYPRIQAGYFAPTYPQIYDIFYPTIGEFCESVGLDIKINESKKIVSLYNGKSFMGRIICRSMEKPSSIVGFKIGYAVVDEIDTMPLLKAKQAWNKIVARMRYKVEGLKNGIDITTTPEGFNFVHERFVEDVANKPELTKLYGLIQASTYDNAANLPDDYIDSLLASYPVQLIKAYLNGQFVNLTSGTVYYEYDVKLNGSDETVTDSDIVLFIGCDFNVTNMGAVVYVLRNGKPHAVDEITGAYDTPQLIQIIKERYWPYIDGRHQRTRVINMYPDSSGGSRKTVDASTSDIGQLKQAGFNVHAHPANPPIKDRVAAVNSMFHNGKGERRLFINRTKCPTLSSNLQKQAYDQNKMPEKANGVDHILDAMGYYIAYTFPINFRKTSVTSFNFSAR